MIDFMFFAKTFALTLVIVLLMQIQIGDRSLEAHTMSVVQTSTITAPLNSVAHGAALAIHDLTQKIYSSLHHNVGKKPKSEEAPKHKWGSFTWGHSPQKKTGTEGAQESSEK